MSGFETDRANRKAAWALFEGRLSQVKADLSARSIKGRMIDKVNERMARRILALAGDHQAVAHQATLKRHQLTGGDVAHRAALLHLAAHQRRTLAPVC